MKEYTVTVQKGNDIEDIDIKANDADSAGKKALESFYYDGWYVKSVKEI